MLSNEFKTNEVDKYYVKKIQINVMSLYISL